MILVSACLLGECCKYSGGHNRNETVRAYLKGKRYLPICPEAQAGLPIPRPPAEIQGGGGADVLLGFAEVRDHTGKDITASFLKGARKVAALARNHDCTLAILKERSPSCGVRRIYDGSFGGATRPGQGVCACLLANMGIEVRSEEDFAANVD